LKELSVYLKKCIEETLIGESSFLDCVIENIKSERREHAKADVTTSRALAKELEDVTRALNDERQKWDALRAKNDAGLREGLEEQIAREEDEALAFDEHWESPGMLAKFNVPSHKLIALREEAHALLVARDFDAATGVAAEVRTLERAEADAASKRMAAAYKSARARFGDRFKRQVEALHAAHQRQLYTIVASEGRAVSGFEQRIRHLKRVKEFADIETKRISAMRKVEPVRKVAVPECQLIAPLGRLLLPPLKTLSHPLRKTEAGLDVIDGYTERADRTDK
jgi:hypothetical protein